MADRAEPRDEDLLRRMAAGDEAAFRAFYQRHQRSVYRFALHMTGKAEKAEEVVQEAFLSLMKQAARFDPERGAPEAYLFGIARNHLRRLAESEGRYVSLADEELEAALGHAPAPLAMVQDSTLEAMARAEMVQQVRRAILALPQHYREAVTLCDLEGRDYSEAAKILDCPIGTVRSRLSRARDMLAEKLRPAAGPVKNSFPARASGIR